MTKEYFATILAEDHDYEVEIINNIPMVIFRDSMNDDDISLLEQIVGQICYGGSWGYKRVVNGQEFRGVIHMNEEGDNYEEDSDTI